MVVPGVVDWEFSLIFLLWPVYNIPLSGEDLGDVYELNPGWREQKACLWMLIAHTIVQAFQDAAIIAQPVDKHTEWRIHSLHTLVKITTSGLQIVY
jgi:hypothetical protein